MNLHDFLEFDSGNAACVYCFFLFVFIIQRYAAREIGKLAKMGNE